MNLTPLSIRFTVQYIALIYLPECDMSKPHRHKLSNASLFLICVKSIGQCSNTCTSFRLCINRTAFIQYCNRPNKIRTA